METIIQKKIKFYGSLAYEFLAVDIFKTTAEKLVELYKEIESDISLEEFTVDFITDAHKELRGDGDLDLMTELVEASFKDLAPHLRNPDVQRILRQFMGMSGTFSDEDLFVFTKNVRSLSKNPNGASVVTLVVNHYGLFKRMLEETGRALIIHSV